MSNKYFAGRGHYIFCDICGQATYAQDVTRLSAATGRPGLLVCRNDADAIDHGLIPRVVSTERDIVFTRSAHTNTTNGTAVIELETTTGLGT